MNGRIYAAIILWIAVLCMTGCDQWNTDTETCVCAQNAPEIRYAAIPNACFWTAESAGYDGIGQWTADAGSGLPLRRTDGGDAAETSKKKLNRTKKIKKNRPVPVAEKISLSEGECIDIRTADETALMRLPGIGRKRADDIIAARGKRPFSSPRSIRRVKGIGEKSYKKMAEYICSF